MPPALPAIAGDASALRRAFQNLIAKEQPHITPRTVDVHIAWLRQKLEDKPDSPRHIATVRGEGYRFGK